MNHPNRWIQKLYRSLSIGRWANEWLPDLLDLFADECEQDDGIGPWIWLARELLITVRVVLIEKLRRWRRR